MHLTLIVPIQSSCYSGEIQDEESGIDRIEYTFLQSAQATLADANWRELRAFPNRTMQAGLTPVFITLDEAYLLEDRTILSLYLRTTNGAGLQTIVNRTIQIPGQDQSPPTEPVVALEHSGFYGAQKAQPVTHHCQREPGS